MAHYGGEAEFIAEKMKRSHIWEAFDQGGLAFYRCVPLEANPWKVPGLRWHINQSDWERGWKHEQAKRVEAA